MKKLALALLPLLLFSGAAQIVPPTTVFTRDFLRSADQAEARNKLGITGQGAGEGSYTSVATIADLPALVRTGGLPLFVFTRGFASEGDRGGALYQWVNSSAATNIYRIAANGGGRWIEKDYLDRFICNVVKAGATPFDSTDDSVAIQRAFDAALQQAHGSVSAHGDEPTIYFPTGRYYVGTPLQYIVSTRNHANINVRGDGMNSSHIISTITTNLPAIYLQNTRLDISDLTVRSSGSGVAADYVRGTGIHLKDCDYGIMDRVRFQSLSRGIVIDCGAMNWNTFRGLQFENCYINIFSDGAQGSTVELHSTTSGHVWFGSANALLMDAQIEATGIYSEFAPAAFWIPYGSDTHIRSGYNESSGWIYWLGTKLTNRVTMTVANQTNVTIYFTNAHHFVTGNNFLVITPEGSVPSDIAAALVGPKTVTGGDRTNNFLQFNVTSPITSNPSGYKFLTVYDLTGTSYLVANSSFSGRGMGGYYNARHTFADAVANIEISGTHANDSVTTARSRNVRKFGLYAYGNLLTTDNEYLWDVNYPQLAQNIFPDPYFKAGTNWMTALGLIRHTAVVPTNVAGRNGILFYITDRPTTGYPLYHADFIPTVPMSSLNGRRLTVVADVWELNHPAYAPTAFQIDSGGSGYVDGLATVQHGGRTIQVNLTTSSGAITGASWWFGAFVTNSTSAIGSLPVTQDSASGGAITPTAFVDRNVKTRTDGGAVKLAYAGETVPGTLGQPAVSLGRVPPSYDGIIRSSPFSYRSNPVDGSKSGLRLFYVGGVNTNTATGCEALFVPFLAVLISPDYQYADQYASKNLIYTPVDTLLTLKSMGASWPGAAPADSASIYSQLASGRPGIRLINPDGVSGWLFHLLPDATSDPANASPGAIYFNTSSSVWRIFTGSSWRNW